MAHIALQVGTLAYNFSLITPLPPTPNLYCLCILKSMPHNVWGFLCPELLPTPLPSTWQTSTFLLRLGVKLSPSSKGGRCSHFHIPRHSCTYLHSILYFPCMLHAHLSHQSSNNVPFSLFFPALQPLGHSKYQ